MQFTDTLGCSQGQDKACFLGKVSVRRQFQGVIVQTSETPENQSDATSWWFEFPRRASLLNVQEKHFDHLVHCRLVHAREK